MCNQSKPKSCVLYINYTDFYDYLLEQTYYTIKSLLDEIDSVKLVITLENRPIQELEFKSIVDLIEHIRAVVQKVIPDLKDHEFFQAFAYCGFNIPCIIRCIQALRQLLRENKKLQEREIEELLRKIKEERCQKREHNEPSRSLFSKPTTPSSTSSPKNKPK